MPATRWLESRWAPVVAGVVAAVLVWVTWGAVRFLPLMHDEWAYWTQAYQYAALQWTSPAPAVPEAFEQLYVLVDPVFASKYWPGHALALAAGFAIGLPALMPLLLTGVAGALTYALARSLAGGRVAVLTFVLWAGTFGNLRFRASYFSELTTSAAWLGAWWALLRWRETRSARWMVVLAACTGWGAITRPATMFVFAIPVGVVVITDVARQRRWTHLAAGVATGCAVLAILPWWSARTTGDWRITPLALYTRQYLPFDVPGTMVRDTPPERALPAEMERVRLFLRQLKEDQVKAPAWRTFAERTGFLVRDAFAGWRLPFVVAFAAGIVMGGPVGWFAMGSVLLLVVAYVTQAHSRDWTVYYLEAFPVVAFLAAVGTRALLNGLIRRRPRQGEPARRALTFRVATIAAVGFGAVLTRDALVARRTLARVGAHTVEFHAGVAALPRAPRVVFVRYADRRNMHLSLVANRAPLAAADTWIVHDLGARNVEVMAMAPGRTAYLYDEASARFLEMVR